MWSRPVVIAAMDWCNAQWAAGVQISLELSCARLGAAPPGLPPTRWRPAPEGFPLPPEFIEVECLVAEDAHGMKWLVEPGGSLLDVPFEFAFSGGAYDALDRLAAELGAVTFTRVAMCTRPANLLKQSTVNFHSCGSARDVLGSLLASLRRPTAVICSVSDDFGCGINIGLVQ